MVFKSLLLALIKRLFIETKKDPTSVWKDEEVLARSTRERHSRQGQQHEQGHRGTKIPTREEIISSGECDASRGGRR